MMFCRENRIAVTDIIASCVRFHSTSQDSQLLVHHYADVIKILKDNSTITRVIITAKSMGTSAHHHFYQYLVMNEIDFDYEDSDDISKGQIVVDGRKISVWSINSTSSRNTHVSESALTELYKNAFKK